MIGKPLNRKKVMGFRFYFGIELSKDKSFTASDTEIKWIRKKKKHRARRKEERKEKARTIVC